MTLIDTNILLDLVTNDPIWAAWSIQQMDSAALRGPLIINPMVYAEMSVRFDSIEALDAMLDRAGITLTNMPSPALFLAGKAFKRYRAAGGARLGVLPDFFIGAHAAVTDIPVMTRDPRRFRTYFPTVTLVTP